MPASPLQEQYVFVYDSLLEALICGDTTVSSHAFPELFNELCLFDPDIGKTKLEEQFEVGDDVVRVRGEGTSWQDRPRAYIG